VLAEQMNCKAFDEYWQAIGPDLVLSKIRDPANLR